MAPPSDYGIIVIRRLAYTFAETNNIAHRFSKEREMAGYDWMKLFMRRHPQLSIRKAEGGEINWYFKLLQTLYQETAIVNRSTKYIR